MNQHDVAALLLVVILASTLASTILIFRVRRWARLCGYRDGINDGWGDCERGILEAAEDDVLWYASNGKAFNVTEDPE